MAIFAWLFLAASGTGTALPNLPVPVLDLHRYAGSWHEIAHLPLFFQRQCVDNITATYTLEPHGTIQVRNACRTRSGSVDIANGVARPGRTQGALQVNFAPRWLRWVPWGWADYWVIDLDPHYQWAVVGSPSKKYLWVLSRTPSMTDALFQQLKNHAAARGYPVDSLIMAAPLK